MEFLFIGGLVLLVVHAACKLNAAKQAASSADVSNLPPNTAITAFGATPTPSPASAMGAPGASNMYTTKLDTNSQYPTNGAGSYTVTGTPPGTNGIPQSFVPSTADAGYDAYPSYNKSLATQNKDPRVSTVNPGMLSSGTVYRL